MRALAAAGLNRIRESAFRLVWLCAGVVGCHRCDAGHAVRPDDVAKSGGLGAPSDTPLAVIATSKHRIDLHPIEGALLVSADNALAIVDGDRLRVFAGALRAVDGGTEASTGRVRLVQGRWPNDAWAFIEAGHGCRSTLYDLAKHESSKWVAHEQINAGYSFIRRVAWGDGRILNLGGSPTALGTWADGSGASAPALDVTGAKGCASNATVTTDVRTSNGQVIAHASVACETEQLELFLWRDGAMAGTPFALPGALRDVLLTAMFARRANDIYLAGSATEVADAGGKRVPFFVHFDGTTWSHAALPQEVSAIRSITGAADGRLWIVIVPAVSDTAASNVKGELWLRSTTTWSRVAVSGATNAIAHGDHLWVTTDEPATLLHNGAAVPPIEL